MVISIFKELSLAICVFALGFCILVHVLSRSSAVKPPLRRTLLHLNLIELVQRTAHHLAHQFAAA